MRFPFAVKLALSISLLAVSVTSLSVVFLYTDTRSMVIRLMAGRLKDVGRTAAYMLESQDREGMKKMATVVRSKIKITAELRKTIADAKVGDTIPSPLTQEEIDKIIQSPDYLEMVQFLRQVKAGSRESVDYPVHLSQVFETDPQNPLQLRNDFSTGIPGARCGCLAW